tara:strand:- start:776 stop:1105 length:330 start_codon:yes stop_codon:yes gene_type:complete
MFVVKNLQETQAGNLECEILNGETWGGFVMSPSDGYEIHESSDWPDIKPCDQDAKDAHEQAEARAVIIAAVAELEAKVTPRRLREALAGDTAFITDIDKQISVLRGEIV